MRKFLVISSYAPPAISGAPLLMYNILQHFPESSFAVLTSHSGIRKNGDSNRWLGVKYYFFDSPVLTVADSQQQSKFQRLKFALKQFWLTKLMGELFFVIYLPVSIVLKALEVIKLENIQLLVAYSDAGPALLSTYLVHLLTGKPYFLFFYDLYADNKLPVVHRAIAKLLEPALIKKAERVFVMCEAVQELYEDRYGREVIVIHNAVGMPPERTMPPMMAQPFRVVYTGTVYWAQADAIMNLVQAIEGMQDCSVQLWLYTPHDSVYLRTLGIEPSDKVIFASGQPSEMPAIQSRAHILVLSLSFNTGYQLLINTSSPGKTYEYMFSGRPMLVHAPSDSYVATYARKENFAYVVDKPDIVALRQAILTLLNNEKLSIQLATNAYSVAVRNHLDTVNASKFKKYF